jgi:pyruvate formate lyase activating enzyme
MEWAGPEAVARAAVEAGCRSVAFTYNDPVIFAEYAIDCAIAARALGLKAVAVTAGYINPEARGAFYEHMDAANVDLKAFTDEFYRGLCFARISPVLDTLRWLRHESEVWFEVTTLLIPGRNDGPEEIDRLCDWFLKNLGPEVPLHFTAFHSDFKLLDVPDTPVSTLRRAREQALRAGLQHVYTGNTHDSEGQSTYCAGCGTRLIERDWYALGAWHLEGGCCRTCGKPLAGRLDSRPEHWGPRRQRVHIPA